MDDTISSSILNSVKQMIGGISKEDDAFDVDLVIHINSVFSDLHQFGVGPKEPFAIFDEKDKWFDFTEDNALFNNVKTYMYLRVKLIFDPPTSSFVLSSFERQIKELEWRFTVSASIKATEETENE